jgi:SAM-dependent methyltransferase
MHETGTQMEMWQIELRTREQFRDWTVRDAEVLASRRALQQRLEAGLPRGGEGVYVGYCVVCGSHSHFQYDWQYSDGTHINWRERLVCRGCKLNNRLRLSMKVATELADIARSPVYLTECLTPFAELMRGRCANLACSEFLGERLASGQMDHRGVRHEDLTHLSFADAAFELVLSFDVFEHIPDYFAALKEVARVLRPGGTLAMTVPLHLGSDLNIVRAKVSEDGEVQHLLPPEYHGDPVEPNRGILCFYHFGWQLLHDLHDAGFSDASFRLYWS